MQLLIAASENPGLYWWVSPLYKELQPISRIIRQWTPRGFIEKKLEQLEIIRFIRLVNGAEIWFHSADTEDALRGSGLDGLVIDEAPQVKQQRWEEELRPSLMDKQGWAIFIGTPKGRNWFHQLYIKGQDRAANPEWESWQMPSSVNPWLDPSEIEAAKQGLPELVYRQEILAQFLEGEGTVFRWIDEALVGSLGDPEPGRTYSLGCDLAKSEDFTVLVALDEQGHLRGFDRFNQLDWGFIKSRVQAFAKRYGGILTIDSTGVGDPIFDDLVRASIRVKAFKFTSESKRQIVENLSLIFDQRKITFPSEPKRDMEILANELKSYTYEKLPSGEIRYGAPEGFHDDCVMALALAAWTTPFKPWAKVIEW